MALSTKPYKGARDFYPEDKRLQKYIFATWRKACERFGYEEYGGPVLEPLELYTAKTSEEIVNEQSYSFTDRGDRKVIMRPEMTPTVSRMVAARRQELAYPLRLYSIVNCFRYERPQRGRSREFWQLNADLFGVEGLEADMEMIQLADNIMQAFGAKPGSYEIRINSRKLLNKRIEEAGPKSSVENVIRVIDRYYKQDREKTLGQLAEVVDNPSQLVKNLETDGPSEEVKLITEQLQSMGVDSVKPVETLARGFDYYTDIVFEVFDANPENNRSMFGGGRYDGLVGQFGVEPLPTVGFGMGDMTLQNFLETNELIPELPPETDIYAVLIGDVYQEAQKTVTELREAGLNIAVDSSGRAIDKQIKTAVKKNIKYALFIGNNELAVDKYNLKNLETGKEAVKTINEIITLLT